MKRKLMTSKILGRGRYGLLGCAAVVLGCGSVTAPAATGSGGASSGAGGGAAFVVKTSTGGAPSGGAAGSGGTLGPASTSTTMQCDSGTERCPCYGNHTCNDGLTCASELCVRVATVPPSTGGTGSSAGYPNTTSSFNPVTGGAGPGATTPLATGGAGSSSVVQSGGAATGGAATGGANSTGGVPACAGIIPSPTSACSAASAEEAKPLGLDMVLLIDRSISNSYALGSETATPAGAGQISRWQVLTAALDTFLHTPEAAPLKVSLTVFSLTGGSSAADECNAAKYANPVVQLGTLGSNATLITDAMQSVQPRGLSPMVPALTGAFQYAMAKQNEDPQREKVVVYLGDGFPNLCDQKSPSDVSNLIAEAASAATRIRTFVIGIGSPDTMDGVKFNLLNYARAGNTGKLPYVLDESAGADGVRSQLVAALLDISRSTRHCDYQVATATLSGVALTFQPSGGELQEIPRVSGLAACSKSIHGGWYFDNATPPSFIRACPCSCSNFGAGRVSLLYGCAPSVVVE